jgi:alpha-L-arabinofuranosidase
LGDIPWDVLLPGAKPSEQDKNPVIAEAFDPGIKLVEKSDGWWLEMNLDPAWRNNLKRDLVTTELLGQAKVPNAPFEHPDGTPYRIETDYFGKKWPENNPSPGPFALTGEKEIKVKVWPKIAKNLK